MIAFYRRPVERPSASAEDWNRYAWGLLEMVPPDLQNPAEALRAAERANELAEGKRGEILDTLAMACYRTGDVRRAVELQRKAVEMIKRQLQLSADAEKRLAQYEAALAGHDE
jgi:tetratricopeptide (TPR) repeat protein